MSRLISSMAASWSGVSTYGKASSSSRCHGVSGPNACPGDAVRAEYSRISSAAISLTALRARPFVFAQSAPPSRCRLGASPPRSEEHTSELQSRRDLVCRLLLEKKNDRKNSFLSTQKKKNRDNK